MAGPRIIELTLTEVRSCIRELYEYLRQPKRGAGQLLERFADKKGATERLVEVYGDDENGLEHALLLMLPLSSLATPELSEYVSTSRELIEGAFTETSELPFDYLRITSELSDDVMGPSCVLAAALHSTICPDEGESYIGPLKAGSSKWREAERWLWGQKEIVPLSYYLYTQERCLPGSGSAMNLYMVESMRTLQGCSQENMMRVVTLASMTMGSVPDNLFEQLVGVLCREEIDMSATINNRIGDIIEVGQYLQERAPSLLKYIRGERRDTGRMNSPGLL